MTELGRKTIAASVERLGFKEDEIIYIRPVYPRDRKSPNYFEGAEFYIVDGNHRHDWWMTHPESRPKDLKCRVLRGKSTVC